MSNPTSFVHRHRKAIAQVITAVYLANPLLVTAQVILNASTPNDGRRAYVDQTQSGITKVNIANPNGAGVSHNTYQQFDVPKTGVVLNNGATNSNTRLAGWVEGNPNLLPGQEAKLILNEVVGAKASQLQGYVEVAGKKADVIIANEQGVTCNGCGFINTERATLTTGKPVFNSDGSVGQLRVEQGQIHIGSEGLQATGSRLDVLSRYVNVQGVVHADQINVVAGSNTVDYASGQITRLQTPSDVTPSGLDVGQLGGMYANQITLMATGKGVGVNLDGQLLGAGQVSIQSDGTLHHKGTTQGDGGVRVQAGELTQTGHIQSQQTIQLQADKLNNSGTLQAGQQVQLQSQDMLQAGAIQARQIQINATGNVDNSGTLTAGAGGLSVQAGAVLDNRTTGRMQSQAQITLQATQLNNAGQIMAQSDVHLQAQDLQNNAHIQAVGQLTAQAQGIQNSATLLASGVTLTTQTLSNSGRIEGERLALQAQDAQSTLTNSGLIAAPNIQIQGHAHLSNTGKISTTAEATATDDPPQNLNIQVGQLNNNGGQLMARNQLDLQTERLDNRSGTIATIDGNLHIQSNTIDNRSGQILQQGATSVMHLRATGALHNGSGQIEGQGQTLTLEAAELSNNSGQIQHTATVQAGQTEPVMTVTVTPSAQGSGQLQNIQGTLSAKGQLRIQAHALITDASDPRRSQSTTLQFMDKAAALSGATNSGGGYDWQADIAANEKATAAKATAEQTAAQAQTAAQQLVQANTLLSQAQTQKTTTASALTQAQASLAAAQTRATAAQAAAQAAPQDATLAQAAQTAQAQVSTAQTAVNQTQTADQQAQTALTQTQADVQAAQATQTAADSANASAQAAYLAALAEVKTVTDGSSGASGSAPDAAKPSNLQLSAPTAPVAVSSGSLVQAGRKLTLTLGAGGLNNRQGRLQAQDIQVQSQGDIWAGQINAQNSLSLQADHMEAEQRIQATSVRINAQRLHNTGRIEGTQELQIEAQRLDNSGTLQSANTQLQGQTAGSPTELVLNNSGLVQGYVNLHIDAAQLLNTGTLSAGQAQIRGVDQLENRGVIFSTGNMSLQGQDIVNNQARIYSMGDLNVEGSQTGQAAGSVFNYAGRIEAQGDVTINANTLTNRAILPSVNQRGFVEHIRDGGNIITRATDTFNADGKKAEIIAGKKLNITAKTVHNDYGILSAWHQVNITTDTLNNTAYGAIQTENMVVKAACYNCHQTVRYADSWGGRIESGGAANLRALVINNRTTDTRDGFAGLSSDPRVVIVDERSGTQSPLTKAFVDRFGTVTGPSTAAGESAPAPLPGPRLLSDNLVLTAYGRFDFSRFVLPDGKTGLFELANPASPYLIQGRTDLIPRETGAQNTVYNQFLGSDYLMTRLGLIPGGAKRLGDAWYETQLVQEQLYALSGRRYLVAGTSNDYDLMRGLMDAGLLAQAQLRLVAGDPLSPEQQQALKQDMVWPEWQDVAGQRVLVPKVYLAQQEDTTASASGRQVGALMGASIAGQSVDIQTTDLNQSNGHIKAGGLLNIDAKGTVQGSGSYSGGTSVAVVAGHIDLANASVQSAGWLKLQTTQGDLNLAATQVKAAGDATLQSAGELNLNAQKHEAHVVRGDGSQKDEVKYETTNIQAGGKATLTSVGDLTAQGSTIAAGQDLKLQSTGGRLEIQSPQSFTRIQQGSDVRQSLQTERSQINAGGNLTLDGQQAVQIDATDLGAGGKALVQSQGDVSLGFNTDTEQHNWTSSSTQKSWGGLKKKTTITQHETLDKTAEVTQIEGAQVQVLANNVNSYGAQLASTQADLEIKTQGSLKLYAIQEESTVKTSSQTSSSFMGIKYSKSANSDSSFNSQALGTTLVSEKNMNLQAGKDVLARAAQVQAGGDLNVNAGRDVSIGADTNQQTRESTASSSRTNGLSSKSTTTVTSITQSQAQGSNFEGTRVTITAGQNLQIEGSNLLADQDITLKADGNVNILAAQNTQSQSSFNETKKSGLLSSGGLAITVGQQKQSLDQQGQSTTAAQSTIGAINGNVTINAGGAFTQTGSDVLTPTGDISITAKTVVITEARETGSQSTEQKFKQSGLTLALSGGVIDTAQAAMQGIQGATGGGSDRSKALNALIAYGKGADLYEQGKAVSDAYDKNGVLGNTGADGKANPGAAAASGIKLSISVGGSSSQSNSNTSTNRGASSTVKAGGNVNIQATGQGPGEGDLTVQGSKVQAAQNITLSAAKDVNIVASADTESNRSSNKSSAASVGLSFGVGAGSAGLSLDIAASKGKGQANGDSTSYTNSQIEAGQQVGITSGADTKLQGGNIQAKQVTATVGGNLNIQSLQDTATSAASQKTTGVALSIPITGAGGSASISQSKQRSDSNYQSVNEQSGIEAGEGGFQINVKNNTNLQGASIVSSASADKNTLSTGTLTTSDLQNSMSASASSSGMSMGTNMLDGKYAMGKAIAGNALNKGDASQSDASATKTAISAAQVTVNGQTTDTSKGPLTDSNGKTVSTDTGNTNRTLAKADVAGLQQQAQQKQADNNLLFKAATTVSDPINKAMTADKKIILQSCQADGQCEQKRVDAKDVKIGSDGKVYVFNNGIMNTEQQALDNAAKQSSAQANSQGVYVIVNPHTGNVVSEIIYAGVDKLNEIAGAVLPISNASQANIDVRNAAQAQGGKVVEVDHSRGSLTSSNATAEQNNQGTTNAAIDTVTFNGAAANAQRMADRVNTVTGGTGTVQQATHKDDKIGTLIGGNTSTGGLDASTGAAHTNYGPGVPQLDKDKVWENGVGSVPVVVQPTNDRGVTK